MPLSDLKCGSPNRGVARNEETSSAACLLPIVLNHCLASAARVRFPPIVLKNSSLHLKIFEKRKPFPDEFIAPYDAAGIRVIRNFVLPNMPQRAVREFFNSIRPLLTFVRATKWPRQGDSGSSSPFQQVTRGVPMSAQFNSVDQSEKRI